MRISKRMNWFHHLKQSVREKNLLSLHVVMVILILQSCTFFCPFSPFDETLYLPSSFFSSLAPSLWSWRLSCRAQQCSYVITALWSLSITFLCPDARRCVWTLGQDQWILNPRTQRTHFLLKHWIGTGAKIVEETGSWRLYILHAYKTERRKAFMCQSVCVLKPGDLQKSLTYMTLT